MASEKSSKLLAEWFWTDRWTGSRGFLLPIEARGLYREMLTQAWRRGGFLPNDHEAIKRACGVKDDEWARCWPLVSGFFRARNGLLFNLTQRHIYAETARLSGVRARAGRRGGVKTQQLKRQATPQANRQAKTQANEVAKLKPPSPSPSPSLDLSLSRGARGLEPEEMAHRGGALVRRYAELYSEHRHGAKYRQRDNLDWLDACALVKLWDDPHLEKLAVLVLTTDDPWISKTDRSFRIFALKASWADDRLRAWEHAQEGES